MSELIQVVTNNGLASTLVGAVVVGLAGLGWSAHRNRRDRRAIYAFLVASTSGTSFSFRSTQAIASHTRLTEDRVEALCSGHPKIRRNEKEKQSWRLIE